MQTYHAVVALFSSTLLLVAQKPSWPDSMDFGPALMTTFSGNGLCGDVDKGLVVRFANEGAVAFDTELLRMAVAWKGKLKLRGTLSKAPAEMSAPLPSPAHLAPPAQPPTLNDPATAPRSRICTTQ